MTPARRQILEAKTMSFDRTMYAVRSLAAVVIIAAMCLFSLYKAHAQNSTSVSISGTVTDASNALVSSATITIKNLATGLQTSAATTNSGFYTVESLSPGDYSVS